MLHVLIESANRAPARGGWTFASVTAHAALIAGAVALTARAAPVMIDLDPEPPPIFIKPPSPAPASPTPPVGAGSFTVTPDVVIPDITLPATPTFDVTRPFASSTIGRILDDLNPRHAPAPTPSPGQAHRAEALDRVVAPIGSTSPDYPATLRNAGVEGEVLAEFVVDTTGRVEPSSIRMVQLTHPLFGDAVRRWLGGMRYRPAELRGERVRQLVQQRIDFTLRR